MDPLSIAASIAGLLQAVAATCKAVKTIKNLPKAFEHVGKHLPLVQRTLNDVQTRLNHRVFADEERRSINKILEDCLDNAQRLKQVFIALEQKCNKDKDSKNWDKLRGWYSTTLQGAKGYRVESLMTDILKDLKQLSLYESFALATREDMEEIRKALDDLSQVESSMEDPGNNQRISVSNSQNVTLGGHGQQNAPLGGHNTFNSGYIISGGQVNIGTCSAAQSSAYPLIPPGIPHPRGALKRIRAQKGKPLKTCYEWILSHDDFKRWGYGDDSRLLWIRGDPGKGKTMLLCGIVETFEDVKSKDSQARIPICFFCQATDDQLKTAESVMQGLLAFLIDESPYSRNEYLDADGTYRADWDMLVQKVEDVLRDLYKEGVYLIIDALDECIYGRGKLLKAIVELSDSKLRGVKILVSSRNLTDIEDGLSCSELIIDLSLERNKPSVGDAIDFYIADQITALARRKRYSDDLREEIRQYLESNSRGTFLWVSLVCKELAKYKLVESAYEVLKLNFPPELNGIYARMVESINHSSENTGLCKQILAIACAVFRPVSWGEMKTLLGSTTRNSLTSIIGLCGSFLSIEEGDGMTDDDKIITFVHLSAKDFLLENQAASEQILPYGLAHQHYCISEKSLERLSTVLRRDIYDLKDPGYLIKNVSLPHPDPLASLRYSCVSWPDHVVQLVDQKAPTASPRQSTGSSLPSDLNAKYYKEIIKDGGIAHRFIEGKYLYWLEALSLLSELSEGVRAIERLELSVRDKESPKLYSLINDARRFLFWAKGGIEIAPLQAYESALMFSPTNSLIREAFNHERPSWIKQMPKVKENWGAYLQQLYSNFGFGAITSVAFSNDDQQLFFCRKDFPVIHALDPTTGDEIRSFEGHRDTVTSIAFSPDGKQMASGSLDQDVKLWDISSGKCTQTLVGHRDQVLAISFPHGSTLIASISKDGVIKVWNVMSAKCAYTLQVSAQESSVCRLAWSSTDRRLLVIWEYFVYAWNLDSSHHKRTTINLGWDRKIAISSDGQQVASASGQCIRIWAVQSNDCTMTLEGHENRIDAIVFSKDGQRIASYSGSFTAKIWDSTSGVCLGTLTSEITPMSSLNFSNDGRRLVTGHEGGRVVIWDIDATFDNWVEVDIERAGISLLAWSSDGLRLASGSEHGTIKLWDATSGTCLRTLSKEQFTINSLTLSSDGQRVASAASTKFTASPTPCSELRVWDATSGDCLLVLRDFHVHFSNIALSSNGQRVSATTGSGRYSERNTWDVTSGNPVKTLDDASRSCSKRQVFNISEEWVYRDGKRLFWVPPEYRHRHDSSVAATGPKIAIGCEAGRVWIVEAKA